MQALAWKPFPAHIASHVSHCETIGDRHVLVTPIPPHLTRHAPACPANRFLVPLSDNLKDFSRFRPPTSGATSHISLVADISYSETCQISPSCFDSRSRRS